MKFQPRRLFPASVIGLQESDYKTYVREILKETHEKYLAVTSTRDGWEGFFTRARTKTLFRTQNVSDSDTTLHHSQFLIWNEIYELENVPSFGLWFEVAREWPIKGDSTIFTCMNSIIEGNSIGCGFPWKKILFDNKRARLRPLLFFTFRV